jgi:hypothetical protein
MKIMQKLEAHSLAQRNDADTEILDQPPAEAEPPDFDQLLRLSMDELMAKTSALQQAWHFGEETDWQLDRDSGELVLTFPESAVCASAQIIGAYDIQSETWTWAWADPSLPDPLKADVARIREYGQQNGFERLVLPQWTGAESDCWYMAALACQLCQAEGAYRAKLGGVGVFMIFSQVQVSPAPEPPVMTAEEIHEHTAAEFRTCADNLEQQRLACCRYLKRGARAGISQAELIARLGLSSPSVLEQAGYSSDAADQVMNLLGRISDEDIAAAKI